MLDLPVLFESHSFERLHNVVSELLAGCAAGSAGYLQTLLLEGADIEGSLQLVGSLLLADMGEEHNAGTEH